MTLVYWCLYSLSWQSTTRSTAPHYMIKFLSAQTFSHADYHRRIHQSQPPTPINTWWNSSIPANAFSNLPGFVLPYYAWQSHWQHFPCLLEWYSTIDDLCIYNDCNLSSFLSTATSLNYLHVQIHCNFCWTTAVCKQTALSLTYCCAWTEQIIIKLFFTPK